MLIALIRDGSVFVIKASIWGGSVEEGIHLGVVWLYVGASLNLGGGHPV